jgi:hypothetical protein
MATQHARRYDGIVVLTASASDVRGGREHGPQAFAAALHQLAQRIGGGAGTGPLRPRFEDLRA